MESMVRDSYEWFIDLVADRRPISAERARELADGRIYSGRQARENNLVDAIGGVRITSRETMNIRMSPAKEGEEDLILHITPGRHTLDGRSALVFVRNRTGSSDVVRTRRQRCFVREVVGQVEASTVVLRFDRIARAIQRYARTDIPVLILPDLIQVVAELDTSDISTMAIQPGHLADTINYRGLPVLNTDRVKAAVRNVMNGLGSGDSVIDGDECGS